MLSLIIFQPVWADDLCSSANLDEQYTLEVLQNYFETKNCEKTLKRLTKTHSISLVEKELRDISMLQLATKLEYLNLSKNQISDLSPLSSLEHLKWVDLSGNPINSMKFLPTESLETFWCVECQITNWETSAKMRKLTNLSLRNNELQTIEIENFPQLKVILLSNNQIVDPSVLAKKNKITVVDLYGNPIDEEKCPVGKKIAKGLRRSCSSMFH